MIEVHKVFKTKQLHTAIDIGNAKISGVCASVDGEEIVIKGVAEAPALGIKKSCVINLDMAAQQVKKVIKELESQTNSNIKHVQIGISGASCYGFNSHGVVAVKQNEVDTHDLARVLEAAKAVKTPADQKIIHAIPQEYAIDDQSDIREPIGMSGVRLEANVHIITGSSVISQNIEKTIDRCGVGVQGMVFNGLASASVLVSPEDRELGVAVIDIGAGMTSLVSYVGGGVHHTSVLPCAGDAVTADIAAALRVPVQEAERLKVEHGIMLENHDEHETIDVNGSRLNKNVSAKWLSEVIEARYQEIFSLIKTELMKHDLKDQLSAGVIITGGGAAIPGCIEMAEMILGMPVTLSGPDIVQYGDLLCHPKYASLAGILRFCTNSVENFSPMWQHQRRYSNVVQRFKKLFQENF